jgi:hypothetical protein
MVDQMELYKKQCINNDPSLIEYLNTDSTIGDMHNKGNEHEEILDEDETFIKNKMNKQKLSNALNGEDSD